MRCAPQDEAWPARPIMSAARFAAFALMVYGVITMNWQSIRAHLQPKHGDPKEEGDAGSGAGSGAAESGRAESGRADSGRAESPGAHPMTRRV